MERVVWGLKLLIAACSWSVEHGNDGFFADIFGGIEGQRTSRLAS